MEEYTNEENDFVELLKKHKDFSVVQSIICRDQNKNWRCPVCKTKLKITKQERYETLDEHVSDPNKREYPLRDAYQCVNKNCEAHKQDVFWNYYGDLYGGDFYFRENHCINKLGSPFGSYSRKSEVEIYKHGLKESTYLSPAFCLWIWQPVIMHNYKANKEGEILKKSYSLKFLKKHKSFGNGYHILVNLCWDTWGYLWSKFKNNLIIYRKTKNNEILNNMFEKSLNRSWCYRWFETFTKLFYFRLYRKYKKEQK